MCALIALFVYGCSHYDELQKNGKESKTGTAESHNAGQNCMRCHNKGEFSEAVLGGGWWNIAGTAYQASGNTAQSGSVELWTGPQRTGKLAYRLSIDALGNFYTAKVVNFYGGVYPVLVNEDGSIAKSMPEPTTTGACNSCHGVTTDRIQFN